MRAQRVVRLLGAVGSRLTSVSGVISISLLLPMTTFLVLAWLYGWQLQAVLSGSMVPTYPVGSLLVIETIDASRVQAGMPIVFEDPQVRGRLVTHRVVGVAPGEALQFWTQGDANGARDPFPVPARMVQGRVMWQISQLGTVVAFLQGGLALPLLVGVPAGLMVLADLRARAQRWRRRTALTASLD